MDSNSPKYRKILVIQTAFLGDAILTTSLIRAMKKTFPHAEIDMMTILQTSEIFKYNPNINKIIIFNKRKATAKLFSFIKLVLIIRKQHYDLAFSVQGSFTSSLLMYLGNIRRRIGFNRQKLLTDKVILDQRIHASQRHLNLLKIFSNSNYSYQTEIFWSEDDEKYAKKIIAEVKQNHQYIVAIAPGSTWKTKRWPKEYYIALIDRLTKYRFKIFLIGGKEDQRLCQKIMEKTNADVTNLAGLLSILQSCSLIEKIDLLISNDSAPLHVANAVKTDVFAIFGPTVKEFGFFPFRKNDKTFEVDLPCRPCSKHGGRTCPEKHFQCMRRILPSTIAREIIDYFNKKYEEHSKQFLL